MRRKTLLMLASFGVLVLVIAYASIAWYTNISNVAGLTFDVGKYDFQANYAGDDFLIQVDEYLNVDTDKAAPGTMGVIPIRVSAGGDVGAAYAINLDFSDMAQEFKDRIRFYYYTKENGKTVEYVLDEKSEDIVGTLTSKGSITEYIYWEWIYTADITPILVAPYEENGELKWTTGFTCMDDMTYEQIQRAVVNWKEFLVSGHARYATVKEKYDDLARLGHTKHLDPLNDANFADVYTKVKDGSLTGRALKARLEELYTDEHDAFDTALAIGDYDDTFTSQKGDSKGKVYRKTTATVVDGNTTKEITLYAYQQAMSVQLLVSGVQAEPLKKDQVTEWVSKGTTIYVTD